ncbi:MAG: hypothetical protein MUD05_07740 [Candidatus Nanopelagicales bacterium]|jgi:hypothetical protein|nr:hypothetical protein [Candidatus Nanopelagicales bacterium]
MTNEERLEAWLHRVAADKARRWLEYVSGETMDRDELEEVLFHYEGRLPGRPTP